MAFSKAIPNIHNTIQILYKFSPLLIKSYMILLGSRDSIFISVGDYRCTTDPHNKRWKGSPSVTNCMSKLMGDRILHETIWCTTFFLRSYIIYIKKYLSFCPKDRTSPWRLHIYLPMFVRSNPSNLKSSLKDFLRSSFFIAFFSMRLMKHLRFQIVWIVETTILLKCSIEADELLPLSTILQRWVINTALFSISISIVIREVSLCLNNSQSIVVGPL